MIIKENMISQQQTVLSSYLRSGSLALSAECQKPTLVSGWSWTSLFSCQPGRSASGDARYGWGSEL